MIVGSIDALVCAYCEQNMKLNVKISYFDASLWASGACTPNLQHPFMWSQWRESSGGPLPLPSGTERTWMAVRAEVPPPR